jgi:hypothetical protein
MKKLALVMASVAGLGFATPSFASDVNASQGRIQLAQAGVSVSIGERPAARSRVIVRERHDRGHHRGWRHHRAHADHVVVVKKRKPIKKKTVIIDRR